MGDEEFRIEGWLIRPSLSRIERAGQAVHLRPKSMEVLLFLARRAGQVVSRAELLDATWPGVSVAEEGLTRCITDIRQAFGDSPDRPAYVETVAKRGYRLIAPVEPMGDVVGQAGVPTGLVVLPFRDLSPGGDQEYFADGLTEQAIADSPRSMACASSPHVGDAVQAASASNGRHRAGAARPPRPRGQPPPLG
jgi:DNA-binding winged helix-turn-helix (wHTH) protein